MQIFLGLIMGVFYAAAPGPVNIETIRRGMNGGLVASSVNPVESTTRRAFYTGAILSLANPLAAVFWLSIGSRVTREPGLEGTTFLFGFLAGCLVASIFLSVLATLWQHRLPAKVTLSISWVCGLTLIGFGLRLGYSLGLTLNIW